jgi:hypothetical protein
MSRDVRGNPSRYVLKNQPRLKLADLLRRRKMTLKQFLDEFGISTYETLSIRCARMGITPPLLAEFNDVVPPNARVNSPQEGVVVLEAPPVVDEISGRQIDPDAPVEQPGIIVLTDRPYIPPTREVETQEAVPMLEAETDVEQPQKKPRKRKESPPNE